MKRESNYCNILCIAQLNKKVAKCGLFILSAARWKVDAPGQAQVLLTGEEILFWKAVRQRRIYGARKENSLNINFQCHTLEQQIGVENYLATVDQKD